MKPEILPRSDCADSSPEYVRVMKNSRATLRYAFFMVNSLCRIRTCPFAFRPVPATPSVGFLGPSGTWSRASPPREPQVAYPTPARMTTACFFLACFFLCRAAAERDNYIIHMAVLSGVACILHKGIVCE